MNKLTALSKLAGAFWHVEQYRHSPENTISEEAELYQAQVILAQSFGHIRRSMSLEDLRPVANVEGFNGKGPAFF